MKIDELKLKIESKNITGTSLIFCGKDDFVFRQYINEISNITGKDIVFIKSENELVNRNSFIQYDDIYVFITDEFNIDISNLKYCYVFCNKTSLDHIKIPELETWQVEDFVSSMLPGLPKTKVNRLCSDCAYNIHRISLEVDKILIFNESETETLYDTISHNGGYSDISNATLFDIANAIENKDYEKLSKLYSDANTSNVNALGLTTTLYNCFKNIIKVLSVKYPNEENTGVKAKQIWVYKAIAKKYTFEQIINIFNFLCDVQEKLVTGIIPQSILLDYLILNILTIGRQPQ